jgi:hypothetical protein
MKLFALITIKQRARSGTAGDALDAVVAAFAADRARRNGFEAPERRVGGHIYV